MDECAAPRSAGSVPAGVVEIEVNTSDFEHAAHNVNVVSRETDVAHAEPSMDPSMVSLCAPCYYRVRDAVLQ